MLTLNKFKPASRIANMYFDQDRRVEIKTAYPPSQKELEIYAKAPQRAST